MCLASRHTSQSDPEGKRQCLTFATASGIAAPQRRVYETLATKDSLRGFWTNQVDGDSEVGCKLSFFFGRPEPSAVMEVVELSPRDRVQWRCVEGPPEWVGTTVTFDLKEGDGETVLLFAHPNSREGPVEFMHHCRHQVGHAPCRPAKRARRRHITRVSQRDKDQQQLALTHRYGKGIFGNMFGSRSAARRTIRNLL